MSIETCPPIERLNIVLHGQGLEEAQVAALASAHLESLGWRMEPRSDGAWFDFRGVYPGSGDGSVYVGPLRDCMGDSRWTADDRGAPDQLLQLAQDHRDNLAVVQIFASNDGDRSATPELPISRRGVLY